MYPATLIAVISMPLVVLLSPHFLLTVNRSRIEPETDDQISDRTPDP
ncbi:MAG: hypothetical protein ACI9CB_001819 [Rhodothermales bacterium]|jgi:hypothetical protein